MSKLAALRAAVLSAPLRIAAKDLLTFAEKGRVRSWRGGRNRALLVNYTAHLIVTGYVGAAQDLFFVVAQWLQTSEVDAAEDAIAFHVDIIDHQTCDVSLAVELSEIIAAEETPDGIRLRPVADPDAQAFDMAALSGLIPGLG